LSRSSRVFIGGGEFGASSGAATPVAVDTLTKIRDQLETLVQQVERQHPDWPARSIERELEALAPVVYGQWKEDTPGLHARLRQVQRWRKGYRNPPKPAAASLYRYLWPVGERQRQEIDPGFVARSTRLRASHRVFLHNCSGEEIREVHIRLDGKEAAYEPVVPNGKFAEVDWYRDEAIQRALVSSNDHARLRYPMAAEFAVDKGRRKGRLEGELLLDASDGWVAFVARDGSQRDLE
jgi:hypothetical protein